MKLTAQAIKRLLAAPIEVRLWNGCYNTATAKVTFARHAYELIVEVTHPLLAWQCGDHSKVSLVFWQSSNGRQIEMPAELQSKIKEMQAVATMKDSEAQAISNSNQDIYRETCREMGFTA